MINTPHDKYFKQLFSQKSQMREFLANGLPQVAKLLDLNTLQLDTTSYIDKKLNATKLNPEQLKEKVAEISQNAVEIVETGAMQIINKAMEKVAIDMIKDGADNQIITKYTKLSIDQIEIIRFTIQELQN